ncbi:MAG: cysteine desulfurase [Synergistaceae bacterium]|jgi:cysteine desulfurase/selenocysteine lyase|nr:cysteine desulfurase [Synergistaceae bacterium]
MTTRQFEEYSLDVDNFAGTTPELSPGAWGLPDERELSALAASFFPEFYPAFGQPSERAYKPTVAPLETSSPAISAEKSHPGAETPPRGGSSRLPYIGEAPLEKIRADFPILSERVHGRPLVWLDNAATTQRPRQVIDRISHYYKHENSNVHRGAHALASRSTDVYEAARSKVAGFIGAPGAENIVFVRGTTEGLNLVANAYVKPLLSPGDEIILTLLEHHANIVPWQLVAEETGAVLRVAPVDDSGQIIISEYAGLFNRNTKFVSMTHVSNALGTIAPVQEMVAIAHGFGVRACVDGAQSVSHMPVNVSVLDADFFVFSGHKLFGPNGIGALYGKSDVLEASRPWQGGGNMIADVTFERTLYQRAPQKFEAGTGNIADAVGLGAAIDYLSEIGMENIARYERELLEYGTMELNSVPGLTLIGTAAQKASVLSFVLDGHSNEKVGKYLDETAGIAVRAGHHCAQPILRRYGLEGTVRPSLAFYNTQGEIDLLVRTLFELRRGG